MLRHGFSHAAATLICSVVASLLANCIETQIPSVAKLLQQALTWLHQWGLSLPGVIDQRWLIAGILAFFWGVLFVWTRFAGIRSIDG